MALFGASLEPILLRGLIPLLVNPGLLVEILVVITGGIFGLWDESLILLLKRLWHKRELSIFLLLELLAHDVEALGVTHVVGVEEHLHDINILPSISHHPLPPLLSHLLGFAGDTWLESWLDWSSLMRIILEGLLLLKSVQSEQLKMVLKWHVLSISEVEQASILLVDTAVHPLVVVNVV